MTTRQILLKSKVVLLLTFFTVSISMAQVIEEEPPAPEVEMAEPPPPPPPPPQEEMFQIVEEMPRFPGCEDVTDKNERKKCAQKKMLEYVYGNLKYPPIARENRVEGTCVIRFYVDKDGSIKDPQVLRDIGAGCGKEAQRVVSSMNNMSERWIPGKQRGRVVKVYYNMPVKFRLDKDKPAKDDMAITKEDIKMKDAPAERAERKVAPPPPPPPAPKTDGALEKVEEMPRFPGCEDIGDATERTACAQLEMLKYIYSNLKYPPIARENSVEGTVVIRFIVDKTGNIKDAEILQDVAGGCGTESLRVVNSMKNLPEPWIPGMQDGKPVNVYYNLPIKFKLESRKKKKKKRKDRN